jgi:hypothetical protein
MTTFKGFAPLILPLSLLGRGRGEGAIGEYVEIDLKYIKIDVDLQTKFIVECCNPL